MAKAKSAWGIDIGQCALKALKLVDYGDGGDVQVEAFEVIEHPEVLSHPDVDRGELIQQALEAFMARHDLKGSTVAVSVPGQNSFTRFFQPPPVETKKLPGIIQYEARQQIPFPIDEVIWQWQAFEDPDSPDIEVGIFAMKRGDIAEVLSHYELVGMGVDLVQIGPLGLYNFLTYDERLDDDGATLLVDVGADKTDLVIADGARLWTRTIQIGGVNFTEALAKSFKLSFEKAEALKRSAATSKYARQAFQVMRPVFADLVQEIQRSIGYYLSLHRDTQFAKLLGMGNGFRLPGLQKFLEQNLNIPVERLDSFKHIAPVEENQIPQFNEGILSFATAYGLAIQELRPVAVETSLLPAEIARKRQWVRKTPWFVAAAAVFVAIMICPLLRSFMDGQSLKDEAALRDVAALANNLNSDRRAFERLQEQGGDERNAIGRTMQLLNHHSTVPAVQAYVADVIAAVMETGDPQTNVQAMMRAYVAESDFDERVRIHDTIQAIDRSDRWLLHVQRLDSVYKSDLSASTGLGSGGSSSRRSGSRGRAGYEVTLVVSTPLSDRGVLELLDRLQLVSYEIADQFPSLELDNYEQTRSVAPFGTYSGATVYGIPSQLTPDGGPGPFLADPFFPEENLLEDQFFEIRWRLAVVDDGREALLASLQDDDEPTETDDE
jgi:type IV pilus assembly protein PilM